ncbi:MAG TPA: hypothetical protein EYQ18_15535 [Candidatus Handelsmanbacteria bacterium]|nr:hypothetical protein [Candidatus Handelsmanbacteria bacterium]
MPYFARGISNIVAIGGDPVVHCVIGREGGRETTILSGRDGVDWAAGAADPRSGVLYVPSQMAITTVKLSGQRPRCALDGCDDDGQSHTGPQALPLVQPPCDSFSAIERNAHHRG